MSDDEAKRSGSTYAIRRMLALGGYLPIPVLHRGKGSLMKGWQRYRHDPDAAMPMTIKGRAHTATGVRCEGLCVIDIDVTDPALAAEIRGMIEEDLGETAFVRYRDRSSKLALFYRQAAPFGLQSEAIRLRLTGQHKLELYCHGGMQIVVHGEHADSTDDAPIYYRWEMDPIWDAPMSALPPVDVAQLREAASRVVHAFPPPDGAEASLSGSRKPPAEAVRQIMTAEAFHENTVALAGVMAAEGLMPAVIREYIHYVYAAVPIEAMTPERRADLATRRSDIDRCITDICRREATKRDSLYREWLKAEGNPMAWNRKRQEIKDDR